MSRNITKNSPFFREETENNGLSGLKAICKKHGIKNTIEYRNRYKEIDGLPAHPERAFQSEWISYSDFFDIPDFISYEELKREVQTQGIQSQKEYKLWVKSIGDSSYPKDPQTVYGDEWENWYDFCGKDKPYKLENITPPYKEWADKIELFMKQAQGGGSKKNQLCRFVRFFIEKHDHSKSPRELLTKKRVSVKAFREELKQLPSDNLRRNIILAVNELLNYILREELTIEDEETGEIVRVLNATNPFQLMIEDRSVSAPQRNETAKPCLQYSFVKKAQEWIIPGEAKTFSDLFHLHDFDADWIKVSPDLIDYRDPDCVIKEIGNETYIWSPVDWIHTYALTKVPLRGRQIAYNDSGEGDEDIADINEKGEIIWIKNPGALAKTTKN